VNISESLKRIIDISNNYDLIKEMSMVKEFSDEAKNNIFYILLNNNSPLFEKNKISNPKNKVEAGGISFSSREEALAKCIGEYVERFSSFFYEKKSFVYKSHDELKNSINPRFFQDKKDIEKKKFYWAKTIRLSDKSEYFLPAHLVFLDYFTEDFMNLTVSMSTGAASATDIPTALLRGIYEVIERDTFMTTYLTKARVKRIDVSTIHNKKVQFIHSQSKKYQFELFLFDITNDFGIPSFLSILVDQTGIGPGILIGTKTSLNVIEAIIGSMEEAFMGRVWARVMIQKRKSNNLTIKGERIKTKEQRALFWSNPRMINKLDFLFREKENAFRNKNYPTSVEESLAIVVQKIQKKGFEIYYRDITHKIFKSSKFVTVKTFIPGMQPLYLDEGQKVLVLKRLNDVSKYFKQKVLEINEVPHPAL